MPESRKPRLYPVAEPDIGEREASYVMDAVRSGWVSSLGSYIDLFERKFAAYCGAQYGISTCNGTAALHLALAALGVGPGDEVIVPTLTFVATANAVLYAGAAVVFADVEPETWCIDPAAVECALTPRTRAVIPVHLYGHPADLDRIMPLAVARGVPVIEDAAEAHGALYKGRRVGGIADVGVFSFYGNKVITTGEGGMLVTNRQELAERARFLHGHAMTPERRYWHPELGFNYRMTNLQAALGVAQLERIDELLARKRVLMQWYRELLADCEGVMLNPCAPWAESCYWLVSALLPPGVRRDTVAAELRREGVDTRPLFYPLHTLPYLKRRGDSQPDGGAFPVAEGIARRGLSLPSGTRLKRDDVEQIAAAFKRALARAHDASGAA